MLEECIGKYFKRGKNSDSRICIVIRTVICFLTVQFAWIFFRAGSRREAFHVFRRIFTGGSWSSLLSESASTIAGFMPDYQWIQRIYIVILILAVLWIAYLDFMNKYGKTTYLQIISGWGTVRRWTVYYLMILSTMFSFVMTTNEYGQAGAFLYFQF